MDSTRRINFGRLFSESAPTGAELISALKGLQIIRAVYPLPLGGIDRLNLEQHTSAALECYESAFEGRSTVPLSNAEFKLLLALHDLGKPQAVAEARLEMQHSYTCHLIDALSDDLELPESLVHKLKTIISDDPIGRCLNKKFHASVDWSCCTLRSMADMLEITPQECWQTVLVYYQCDVWGYPSLRSKVFTLNPSGEPKFSNEGRRFLLRDQEEAERFGVLERLMLSP